MQNGIQSQTEMLLEAKACLRQRDYESARVLAEALIARDPNDTEAIRILLAADTAQRNRPVADEGFLTRRAGTEIKNVLFGAIVLVVGFCFVFRGISVGWNGTHIGYTKRGGITETRGSSMILGGLAASAAGGLFLFLGLSRFRLR